MDKNLAMDYTTMVSIFVFIGGVMALIGGILGRTKECRNNNNYLLHRKKCQTAFFLFYIGIFMVIVPVLAPLYLAWVEANMGNLPLSVLL